jgi:hypothetical protein
MDDKDICQKAKANARRECGRSKFWSVTGKKIIFAVRQWGDLVFGPKYRVQPYDGNFSNLI